MTDRTKKITTRTHAKPMKTEKKPKAITRDVHLEWCRGYFSAVAAYLRVNCAKGTSTPEADSLFRMGGDCSKAHLVDIQTFRDHGLI